MTDEIKPIECKWIPQRNDLTEETRAARYSNSMYWEVPEFGRSKWIVLGYLDVDWVSHVEVNGKSQESIIKGCLAHLNKAPERKPYQKKEPKPLYGNLELFRATFKVKNNKPYIIAELITDDQKNEHFWNEGPCPVSFSSPKQKRSDKTTEKEE